MTTHLSHCDKLRMAADRRAMADALEKRAKGDADRELVAKLREDAAALEGRAGRTGIPDAGERGADTRTHKTPKPRSGEQRERDRLRKRRFYAREKLRRQAEREAS